MKTCRIIGLDPGLRLCGWGIIDTQGNRIRHVAHGVIKPDPKQDLPHRLMDLHKAINDILDQFQPDEAAVEETFVNANPAAALKLGQARGVILMTPSLAGLPVGEYAANKIKKSVVGVGHADKKQVIAMIGCLLPGCDGLTSDSADALSIAICHSHHRNTLNQWNAA